MNNTKFRQNKKMYPSLSLPKLSYLTVAMFGFWSYDTYAEDFFFDPSLFQGSVYGQNIAQFNDNDVKPSTYLVNVLVNNQLIRSDEKVEFVVNPENNNSVEPCLSIDLMKSAHLIIKDADKQTQQCHFLNDWVNGASWKFDQSDLRLNLSIPQAYLEKVPRGYVPPSEWDKGETVLFVRHNTNFTWTENTGSDDRNSYLWSSINAGTNLGLWQIRHQGNFRYVDNALNNSTSHYSSIRTWAQRPIEQIDSILTVGQTYTDSNLFGSLSFTGAKIATDQRMWPQSKRGYAPEVRGVAQTSARVVIRQQGRIIYETTVAPGPFVINDLYNTSNQGDLNVEIIEANGSTSTFTVPYAAVPESVRPGNWRYSLSAGKVRGYNNVNNNFFEATLQNGLTNNITSNFGTRIATNYQALLAGGVLSTSFGAIGANATWSNAKV